MKNTRFVFYITCLSYNKFEKVIFHCVLKGQPFECQRDAQEWISDHIFELMDLCNTSTVFDHVIVDYRLDDAAPFEPKILETHAGRLVFADEDLLKPSYEPEPFNAKVRKTKEKPNEELKSENRVYPSCWIDPGGKFYFVGFAEHDEFAHRYLCEEDPDYNGCNDGYGYDYEVLEGRGWIRILGWTDPPTFSMPERPTPMQRKAVKDYCQSNGCNLPSFENSY